MSNYTSQSNDFIQAYLTCALWASTCEDGESLDDSYDLDDLAVESKQSMTIDCYQFLNDNSVLIDQAIENYDYSYSQAGHDFWLTRNGHGAGFWDRGLNDLGDKLTLAAKSYGSCDLYVGDDGKIYC